MSTTKPELSTQEHTQIEDRIMSTNTEGLMTHTTDVNSRTPDEQDFKTLVTGFAMAGHALHRTDPKDGAVTYWAERWGMVRHLPTIDAARRFLEQIGGRL